MSSSDADMARQLQEQFDREEAQHLQRDHVLQQQQHTQPSQPLTLAVTVPAGTSPGQKILVQAPSGQQVQVQLPPHAVPGHTMQVSIPPQLLAQPEALQPEPEGLLVDAPAPPVPLSRAEEEDLAKAIQASLGATDIPRGPSSSAPLPTDPFAEVDGSAAPDRLQHEPHPSVMTGESAVPSIVGTSGVPLNNGAVELQLYCVDTTTSSSTLYVFAISRVGVEQPSHTVSKSYADFVDLNEALREELNAIASANTFLIGAAELASALPALPQKNTIGRRKAVVIAERQEALTQYLQAACAHPLLHDSLSLSLFLANPSTAQGGDDMAAGGSVLQPGQVDDQPALSGLPVPGSNDPPPPVSRSALGAATRVPNSATSTQHTSVMMVTVPADGAPGQKLRVVGPSGHDIELVIPDGAIPGQQLQVQAAIPPPQQACQGPHETESVTWTVKPRQPHVDASGHVVYPFAVTVTTILPALHRPLDGAGALLSLRGTLAGEGEEETPVPESASASPWDDAGPQASAVAPPVRKMSLPDESSGGGSPDRVEVYELCLRYSEWAALDSKLSTPPSVRNDPQVRLPELPNTSTVGRSKDRVMAERSKLILDYLQALCSQPTARNHPSFRALLETGKAAESSRQQLLGRVEALETELAKRTMTVSILEAENNRLSKALKEAEGRLSEVGTPLVQVDPFDPPPALLRVQSHRTKLVQPSLTWPLS